MANTYTPEETRNEMQRSDQSKAKNGLGGMEDRELGDNGYGSVKSKRPQGFKEFY